MPLLTIPGMYARQANAVGCLSLADLVVALRAPQRSAVGIQSRATLSSAR
jgi:hypothetical protein